MLGTGRTWSSASVILAGLMTFACASTALLGASPPGVGVAQPTNYVSPSGVYALYVDPADRYGEGGAKYRLSKNGVEVWSGEKPYTLREAVVTDEGLAAGFAYRTGPKQEELEGQPRPVGGPQNPPEYLHIVVFGADGREVLNDVTERVHPPYLSEPPSPLYPYLEQLMVDPANDRVIARVGARGARWWVYRLSTGESLSRFDPAERMEDTENLRHVLEARPVAQTPLLLVHWYLKGPDYKTKDDGGRFTLLDAEFNPVWSFDAANDYAELDLHKDAFMGRGPSDYFQDHPAILRTDKPRRFGIRLFAENKEVAFSVRPVAEGGYEITELGRIDIPDEDKSATVPFGESDKALTYLGELELAAADAEASPFQDLWDFTFDGNGHIYFLRKSKDALPTLVHVNQTGKPIGERTLRDSAGESFHRHWTEVARHKDDYYYVVRKAENDEYTAWLVHLPTGEEKPFEHYPGGYAVSISRFADGGFVVLDTYSNRYSPADRLRCFANKGELLWQMRSDDQRAYEILGIGPDDVAVTSEQRIVLLNINALHLLDRDGTHLRKIDLTDAFGNTESGGRPGYLNEVVADADGGFLVANHRTPPVVLRYNSDGSLRSRWSPRHPDGKTFDLCGGVNVAPDGRVWTSDGRAIMRLADDGVVDLVLGPTPRADRLERIAGFTVDRGGKLYAVAHGTGAIHLFDRSGKLEKMIEPNPADVPGTVKESFVAVDDRGVIHLRKPRTTNALYADTYLRFSPDGERLDEISFKPMIPVGRFLSSGWTFQPKSGYRCGICQMRGDTRLVIVDPPDKLVREVRRRPNGRWFGDRTNLAMAANGSMAILDHDIFGEGRVYEVDLFSANGDPIRTIRLPPPREHYTGIAYDGRRVVVAGQREVAILDTADDSIEERSLIDPGVAEGQWSTFIMPDSNELLLFDERGGKLHRYELPRIVTEAEEGPTAKEADIKKPPDPSEAVVGSDWVKEYLDVLATLPKRGPCVAYIQKIEGGERALTEAAAMELPEEERSAMRTISPGDCGILFDSPRVYARLLDILAATGVEDVEGLRVLDLGCCDIRHLQALARLGVDAVGVQAGYSLTAMCNDWDDVGEVAGPEGQVGHLEVIYAVSAHQDQGLVRRG